MSEITNQPQQTAQVNVAFHKVTVEIATLGDNKGRCSSTCSFLRMLTVKRNSCALFRVELKKPSWENAIRCDQCLQAAR